MPDEKQDDKDYDWIGRDEWDDPVEQETAPLWVGLFILFLIWISGIIIGAYSQGWRI